MSPEPGARIYVAGHTGLAGSALVRCLRAKGFGNLLLRTHAELDLTDAAAVRRFFEAERPQHVIVAAAKVGGILANETYPAEFIHQNLAIANNVVHEAWRTRAERLLYLGSSCIYPRDCPQPMKEEYLLTGALEATNRAYAIAKIAGIEICWSYNRQYGTKFLAAMPTNLFGPQDHYDLLNSHVLPALIRKAHEAKTRGERELVVWGTGRPRREFMYSDDMADACVFLLTLDEERFAGLVRPPAAPLVNIGTGNDLTIAELAALVCDVVGFHGRVVQDTTRPDGTPRKLLDVSKLHALGWHSRISLRKGIELAYEDYKRQLETKVSV